jgi:hypothetical protein
MSAPEDVDAVLTNGISLLILLVLVLLLLVVVVLIVVVVEFELLNWISIITDR